MSPTLPAVWVCLCGSSFCVPLGQPTCLWPVPGVSEHSRALMCAGSVTSLSVGLGPACLSVPGCGVCTWIAPMSVCVCVGLSSKINPTEPTPPAALALPALARGACTR